MLILLWSSSLPSPSRIPGHHLFDFKRHPYETCPMHFDLLFLMMLYVSSCPALSLSLIVLFGILSCHGLIIMVLLHSHVWSATFNLFLFYHCHWPCLRSTQQFAQGCDVVQLNHSPRITSIFHPVLSKPPWHITFAVCIFISLFLSSVMRLPR